jgi:hypothetical protein
MAVKMDRRKVPERPAGAVTWREALEEARRAERQEWLLGVGATEVVVKLLGTWSLVERSVPRPRWLDEQWTCVKDPVERWEWLWRERFPDGWPWEEWALLSGVVLGYRVSLMEQMKALHIVYPDGSVSNIARQLLVDRIAGQLPLAKEALARRGER